MLLAGRLDPESIVSTRRQIQRYARDMNFNMAMIVVMLVVFIASVAAGTGR